MGLGGRWLSGQGADLEQVVGEDPVAAPDGGAGPGVQAGAVPAVAALEVADASFAAGAPPDQLAEAGVVLGRAAGGGDLALAGDRHGVHAQLVQVALEGGLAVAAVSGYRAGDAARAAADPVHGRRELRPVGSGAALDGVVEDDAVVVVGDLGFVPELDR